MSLPRGQKENVGAIIESTPKPSTAQDADCADRIHQWTLHKSANAASTTLEYMARHPAVVLSFDKTPQSLRWE